jgi:hypothetical protein
MVEVSLEHQVVTVYLLQFFQEIFLANDKFDHLLSYRMPDLLDDALECYLTILANENLLDICQYSPTGQ